MVSLDLYVTETTRWSHLHPALDDFPRAARHERALGRERAAPLVVQYSDAGDPAAGRGTHRVRHLCRDPAPDGPGIAARHAGQRGRSRIRTRSRSSMRCYARAPGRSPRRRRPQCGAAARGLSAWLPLRRTRRCRGDARSHRLRGPQGAPVGRGAGRRVRTPPASRRERIERVTASVRAPPAAIAEQLDAQQRTPDPRPRTDLCRSIPTMPAGTGLWMAARCA